MRVDTESDVMTALSGLERKIDLLTRDVASVRRHFVWQRIFSIFKLCVIGIPIVWALMRWLPALRQFYVHTSAILDQAERVLPKG